MKAENENLPAESDEFGTPETMFERLHCEFDFTIDVCASQSNHKLPRYYTKEDDALKQSWVAERVFCNPPYSRGFKEAFGRKMFQETTEGDCVLGVMILPTCTDQPWFHEVLPFVEVRFLQGRVKFVGGATQARDTHMILVFRNPKFLIWRGQWK